MARAATVTAALDLARHTGFEMSCRPEQGELLGHGPFDLLVLDGGGQGKRDEPPLDPMAWLRPGGLIVIDDFTPSVGWPPMYGNDVDTARLYWLEHPALRAAQITLAPDAATIVATMVGIRSGAE